MEHYALLAESGDMDKIAWEQSWKFAVMSKKR
jgi:hypothetical protein